jgi:hypothetical protein
LQLLRELIPKAARFGSLVDPAAATKSVVADLQMAARTLGLQLFVANARTESDLEPAFVTLSQQRVDAVLVSPSTLYNRRTEQLAALAARYALPAIFPFREYAVAGGLMSYGTSLVYAYHQVGIYNAHEGYVSWERAEAIRKMVSSNVPTGGHHGAPKHGDALLAGLVRCNRCGHKLTLKYTGAKHGIPRYSCS